MAKVLVIDPETHLCRIHCDYLRDGGHDATPVSAYLEALLIADKELFDVYVLDCDMANQEEGKLLNLIRSVNPKAPVFFSSSHCDSEKNLAAIRATGHELLMKPFHADIVCALIEYVLKKKSA